MKKRNSCIFIVATLFLCMIPLLFIGIAGKQETTENREKAKFPKVTNKGKANVNYLGELGTWFEDNFAFRQELVSANATVMDAVFGVSASDQIISGSDGWLYYSATLDDYNGKNQMSDRGVYNVAHIIEMMEKRAEEKGAKFVFLAPPNKNTLYPENMPYYVKQTDGEKNLDRVAAELKKKKVNYVDVKELFEKQDEVLYLKKDSHWNNKGAMLVYNSILDSVKWPHNDYSKTTPEKKSVEVGDLAKMLYPETATPEENHFYPVIFDHEYVGDVKSVEDNEIKTLGYQGTGSLLMYRDSFGNTLLPIFAPEFAKSMFSKLTPYYYDKELEDTKADVVVVERVERHLSRIGTQPPVMEGLSVKDPGKVKSINTDTEVQTGDFGDGMYVAMGTVDEKYMEAESQIYVRITGKNQKSKTYEALPATFNTEDSTSDYGYHLYLKEKNVPKGNVKMEILVKSGNKITCVKSSNIAWKGVSKQS